MPKIFISEDWFKKETIVPFNLDSNKIYPFWKKSQDIHIRTILGDNLYFRLYNKTNDQLNNDDKDLLDLIAPCMSAYMVYDFVKLNVIKVNNKGITQDADTATDYNIEKSIGTLKNDAEFYKERIIKYLCNNKDKYPEYTDPNADINPSKISKTFGFSDGNNYNGAFIKKWFEE